MQLLKLTGISSLVFGVAVTLLSCEKEADRNASLTYTKSDIAMTGAQSVPSNPSAGTGILNVTYTKSNKMLTYSFNWTGLTDTIRSINIMGPAPVGYASASIKQALPGFGTDLKANQKAFPYQAGSYSGSVYIDEFALKEQELLNYFYYVTINTKTYATGEIRGQIRFQ